MMVELPVPMMADFPLPMMVCHSLNLQTGSDVHAEYLIVVSGKAGAAEVMRLVCFGWGLG